MENYIKVTTECKFRCSLWWC